MLHKRLITLFLIGLFILPTTVLAQQQKTHKIVAGETLYSISRKYGLAIDSLRQWNKLNSNSLKAGSTLFLTAVADSVVEQQKAAFEASLFANIDTTNTKADELLKKDAPKATRHKVTSGQSLYSISRKYGMSIKDLKELNNLRSNTLRIGQVLIVGSSSKQDVVQSEDLLAPQGEFQTYTLSRGENYEKVLEKFKMDSLDLVLLNPDVAINSITGGSKISVLTSPDSTLANPYLISASFSALGNTNFKIYDKDERGNITTSGHLYNPELLSAASDSIPLGTVVYVENPVSHKGIYVLINDRIPFEGIKISEKAAQILRLKETDDVKLSVYSIKE